MRFILIRLKSNILRNRGQACIIALSNSNVQLCKPDLFHPLVMASVDLNTVRELLGNSDMAMTLRYALLAPEHKASAGEKLVNTIELKKAV